jgi:hypothetical protein
MRLIVRTFASSIGIAAMAAMSCSTRYKSATQQMASDTLSVAARIAQLEAAARALAKTDGCSTSEQCRTAPVGAKGCGGPRTYLVYCAASTDSVALFRKLDSLRAIETTYNASSGMAGTCDFRTPPTVTARGGSCRESTP